MAATWPDINGIKYDWSSVEINLRGRLFTGFKEIAYSDKLEPSKMSGTSAEARGRTRGKYDADGSFTMYKEDGQDLIDFLGNGYGEVSFPITVHYANNGSAITTDTILGCRITGVEDSHSEGGDALVQKFTLSVMKVRRNGKDLVANSNIQ